jgi:CheY-like chemotaxis protein
MVRLDLVVPDIMLPELDGLLVLRKLLQETTDPRIQDV